MARESAAIAHYMEATEVYLRGLEAEGASKYTIRNYSVRLNSLYEFMINNGYTNDGPTFRAIMDYKTWLKENGKSVTTIHQYMTELNIFFNWASSPLLEQPFYQTNPVLNRTIPSARREAKRPYKKILEKADVIKLLSGNIPTRSYNWDRNYAIVVIILTTAIRNAELLDLTLDDLDFDGGWLTIQRGKGNKERTIQFPAIAQEAVKAYLRAGYRPADAPSSAPLFGTTADSTGHKVRKDIGWHRGTAEWLSGLVERHVEHVTGKQKIKTHALRHACAKTLLESGMSMEEIQAILGHESVKTTEIYAGRLCPQKAGKRANEVFEEMEFQAKRAALRAM